VTAPILTRERLHNLPLAEAKAYADAKLGTLNDTEIAGHAPGTLRCKAAKADGGTERWRLFFEWEPIGTAAIEHGVFQ